MTATAKPFCKSYHRKHPTFAGHKGHRAGASFPPGTFAPGQVPVAYGFPQFSGAPKVNAVLGIVCLGGAISTSDVQEFCGQAGYPMPNLRVITVGGASQQADPGGADVENMLDVQLQLQSWNRAYPNTPATIIVCIAPNAPDGIEMSIRGLRLAGCTDISCSWGSPLRNYSPAEHADTEEELQTCNIAGITVSVASGDNSADDGTNRPTGDYPACSRYVWACGGTNLTLNQAGGIATEKAWGTGNPRAAGGGGGYDTTQTTPEFQMGLLPAGKSGRGEPDSSLNADPNTGYQMVSGGEWTVVGGTSAAAPGMAGLFAAIRASGGNLANYQTTLYASRKTAFNDIVLGSDGNPTLPGWDAATGNGSVNGPGFLAALQGVAPPVIQPTQPTQPTQPVQPPIQRPPVTIPINPPARPPVNWEAVVWRVIFLLNMAGVPASTVESVIQLVIADAQAGMTAVQIIQQLEGKASTVRGPRVSFANLRQYLQNLLNIIEAIEDAA